MSRNRINLEIEIPNQTRYLGLIGDIGERLARGAGERNDADDSLAYAINLALTEALSNAIKYGSGDEASVRVSVKIEADGLCIQVFDQGAGFDLDSVPQAVPETLCESGRGIFLIRQLMDSVAYRKTEQGNVLEMRKKLA